LRDRKMRSSAAKTLPSPMEGHIRNMATGHTNISRKKTKVF
jgi:hypothetical protein